MIKQLVGRVKEDATDDWKLISGLELAVVDVEENFKELLVIRPIQLEQIEKFYKVMHETFGKKEFYEEYDYFVCYATSNCCDDLIMMIDRDNLENIREASKEDILNHNKNVSLLKSDHKWDIYKRDLEEC